jgi:hypothetical protein
VGGEPVASLSRADEDLPSTLSPRAQAQRQSLRMVRDLWGGNETVKAAGTEYLPQAPGEGGTNYAERLARSVFFNVFRQTVVGLVGLIFRKDPVLGDDVPPQIVEDWENIDLAGTHADVFLKELETDAIAAGHAAILVDFPVVPEGSTAAAEVGLRPYWVPIRKEQILSWRTGNLNGVTVLTQAVIQLDGWADVGEFGEALHTEYLVINRDPETDGPITWRTLVVGEDKSVHESGSGSYKNQIEIPLAEVVTSGRVSMFVSQPPLIDLAFLNIAHYQMWSDYATGVHMTNVPVWVMTGVDGKDDDGNDVEVVIGTNTSFLIPDPAGGAGWEAHDGQALGSTKTALDDLKSDMGALGLAMLSPQKRAAETAEAKRLDKSTSDSTLGATARGLQDAVEVALGFHAKYLGLPNGGGSVQINRDFEGLMMDAPVMQAYAALRRVGFPGRLVLKSLQAGGRIPEDEDLEALEAEMEANHAAEAEAERMEAEERGRQLAQGGSDEIEVERDESGRMSGLRRRR